MGMYGTFASPSSQKKHPASIQEKKKISSFSTYLELLSRPAETTKHLKPLASDAICRAFRIKNVGAGGRCRGGISKKGVQNGQRAKAAGKMLSKYTAVF